MNSLRGKIAFKWSELLLGVFAIALWLWISHDGRLHWDEPGYLYTAAYIPWQQILYEGFEPSGIPGFNVSRLGHIAIMKGIAAFHGPGLDFVNSVIVVYLLMLVALAVTGYLTLRLLMPGAKGLGQATLLSLFAPMTVFLAFKTCPDIPALLFAALSCLFLLMSLEHQTWLRWLILSAIFLALTGLTKHVHAWIYISFAATILLFGQYKCSLRNAILRIVAIGIGSLILFGLTLFVLKIPLSQFLEFMAVANQQTKPLVAKLFQLSLTYGLFLLALPLALLNPNRRWKWFMVVWLCLATVPFLVILSRLETRYLTLSVIPLAGLVWLALDTLKIWANRMPKPSYRTLWAAGMVSIIVSAALIQPLTEHEVRTDQFATAIDKIQLDAGDQPFSVLVPWEYADFHYLRVAYPELSVFSVYENNNLTPDELIAWQQFQDKYYDDRVLRTLDGVNALPGLKYYIGFESTFSIENLRQMLESLPLGNFNEKISAKIQSISPLRQLEKSWMWNHSAVNIQAFSRVGHYQIFRVSLLPQSDSA
ncbi:glycosyltransferase family 39 protein [Leptothoe sp. EHU-05/26/07-4]